MTPRSRNHSAKDTSRGPTPSKPEYAAAYAPLENTASIGATSRAGWNEAPEVSTTQCTGQLST
ncbi:hypothetical protein GCM10010483_43100 [Actinokineospora diospyrosa]